MRRYKKTSLKCTPYNQGTDNCQSNNILKSMNNLNLRKMQQSVKQNHVKRDNN